MQIVPTDLNGNCVFAIFYVTVSQCKWVSGVDTYEAEIAAASIIGELFAKKSAECLNLRNSFITISNLERYNSMNLVGEVVEF